MRTKQPTIWRCSTYLGCPDFSLHGTQGYCEKRKAALYKVVSCDVKRPKPVKKSTKLRTSDCYGCECLRTLPTNDPNNVASYCNISNRAGSRIHQMRQCPLKSFTESIAAGAV